MRKLVLQKRFMATQKPPESSGLDRLLVYAGMSQSADIWLGGRVVVASAVGLLCSFLPVLAMVALNSDLGWGTLKKPNIPLTVAVMALSAACGFGAVLGFAYLHLYYVIHDRTRRIEEILPDFLLMVAAHMRAGLTPFAAFQSAARPEFGPLETEVKSIAAHSMGTESFTESLQQLSEHIDSSVLRRTMAFFENGLRSGGKLANLLETAADEIRDLDELRRETVLNTRTYTIFLVFILVGGLPILLGISTEFLSIFTKMQNQISGDALKGVGSMMSPSINISEDFVAKMAVVIIVLTSIMVSIFIGVISEGKLLFGLKYSPPLAILSYAVFFAVRTVLHGFLGAFFG